MKAHGIPSNNGAQAGPAPSGPSTPTTPAGSKSTPKGRASSAKKRKLAALGDDLDEDDKGKAKTQIKEAKHEASNDGSNGSYMISPTGPPPQLDVTAANARRL